MSRLSSMGGAARCARRGSGGVAQHCLAPGAFQKAFSGARGVPTAIFACLRSPWRAPTRTP
eukprot:8044269-Pyramimonas_sp.AAC.1